MDVAETREQAQRFIAALQKLEQHGESALELLANQFSADARLTNGAMQLRGTECNGLDEIRAFWQAYAQTQSELRSEFTHITSSERAAGLFWTARGTDRHGQAFEHNGASLLVFGDEGKIVLFQGYYDTRSLAEPSAAAAAPAEE